MSTPTEPAVRHGDAPEVERPVGRSIMRGLMNRCPACGNGKLFRAFLKPVDHCAVCGEAMYHQRADDLPPYIVILILGHVVVGGYMLTDMTFVLPVWMHLAIWAPITVITALASIQPIKGGVIGLQWALRMHGFGGGSDDPGDYDIPGRSD
ncbi:uncharacterized protein (DUF983 family) [Rhizobium leguminosarum]|uniref:Uncharacterized protein (DUF983 family) n=1 Tax=Rhizobium leguminosarum TaxID=384 RepID=A0AAE2MHZ7_RHILE|nr:MULTISPECIES: DUF983 domain-containing protein [Rhizobium]MBB4289455.1 uncharacterized protein (DUF983 family) [Rhizobium leguminosarum]MBB4294450.1 uncharacterized protein (DUF983 family) [Rhizobium leguminosarum]MBB4305845.1 uncharacterized protein (DUF983 family) [Rhizobium leguminosarum]MBB4418577.1 uncharacterized protein (DUF983 family) [Rhizobium leguminosarum]MBB4433422.1 uncharacterized protein (DUF983 family) [Rhizobium esperanzae]